MSCHRCMPSPPAETAREGIYQQALIERMRREQRRGRWKVAVATGISGIVGAVCWVVRCIVMGLVFWPLALTVGRWRHEQNMRGE